MPMNRKDDIFLAPASLSTTIKTEPADEEDPVDDTHNEFEDRFLCKQDPEPDFKTIQGTNLQGQENNISDRCLICYNFVSDFKCEINEVNCVEKQQNGYSVEKTKLSWVLGTSLDEQNVHSTVLCLACFNVVEHACIKMKAVQEQFVATRLAYKKEQMKEKCVVCSEKVSDFTYCDLDSVEQRQNLHYIIREKMALILKSQMSVSDILSTVMCAKCYSDIDVAYKMVEKLKSDFNETKKQYPITQLSTTASNSISVNIPRSLNTNLNEVQRYNCTTCFVTFCSSKELEHHYKSPSHLQRRKKKSKRTKCLICNNAISVTQKYGYYDLNSVEEQENGYSFAKTKLCWVMNSAISIYYLHSTLLCLGCFNAIEEVCMNMAALEKRFNLAKVNGEKEDTKEKCLMCSCEVTKDNYHVLDNPLDKRNIYSVMCVKLSWIMKSEVSLASLHSTVLCKMCFSEVNEVYNVVTKVKTQFEETEKIYSILLPASMLLTAQAASENDITHLKTSQSLNSSAQQYDCRTCKMQFCSKDGLLKHFKTVAHCEERKKKSRHNKKHCLICNDRIREHFKYSYCDIDSSEAQQNGYLLAKTKLFSVLDRDLSIETAHSTLLCLACLNSMEEAWLKKTTIAKQYNATKLTAQKRTAVEHCVICSDILLPGSCDLGSVDNLVCDKLSMILSSKLAITDLCSVSMCQKCHSDLDQVCSLITGLKTQLITTLKFYSKPVVVKPGSQRNAEHNQVVLSRPATEVHKSDGDEEMLLKVRHRKYKLKCMICKNKVSEFKYSYCHLNSAEEQQNGRSVWKKLSRLLRLTVSIHEVNSELLCLGCFNAVEEASMKMTKLQKSCTTMQLTGGKENVKHKCFTCGDADSHYSVYNTDHQENEHENINEKVSWVLNLEPPTTDVNSLVMCSKCLGEVDDICSVGAKLRKQFCAVQQPDAKLSGSCFEKHGAVKVNSHGSKSNQSISMISDVENYECVKCNVLFSNKDELYEHQKVHLKVECPDCGKVLSNNDSLKRHIKFKHVLRDDRLKCTICGLTRSARHMKFHMKLHENPNRSCPKCHKILRNKKQLNMHLNNVHAVGAENVIPKNKECLLNQHTRVHPEKRDYFLCDLCGQELKSSGMRAHLERHANVRKFTCTICDLKFFLQRELNRHYDRIHIPDEDKPHTCVECGRKFLSKKQCQSHFQKKHAEPKYRCEKCGRRYLTKSTFDCHKPFCGNPRKVTRISKSSYAKNNVACLKCNKTFKSIYGKILHMKIHVVRIRKSQIMRKCKECGKEWHSNAALRVHMRSHTGEKPFECHLCGKRYTTTSSLNKHVLAHQGKKPFECHLCGIKHFEKGHLKDHMNIHTGEKPYKCEECGRGFANRSSVWYHSKIHKGEKSQLCQLCGKGFRTTSTLNIHMRTHNKKVKNMRRTDN